MKKKTILFFEDSSKIIFGGGQELSLLILKALKPHYNIHLFDYAEKSIFLTDASSMGFQHTKLRGYGKVVHHHKQTLSAGFIELILFPLFLIINIYQIRKYIKQNSPSGKTPVLFAATNKTAILTILISIFMQSKTLFYAYTVYNPHRLISKLLFIFLKKCDLIFSLSETVKKSLPVTTQLLPGAVEMQKNTKIHQKAISPNKKIVVATFANLQKWKGIKYFIKSFSLLQNSKICEYRIYGDGPEKEHLAKLAGGTPEIQIKGFSVFKNIHHEIDIIILPSIKPEAFGMNIIKAMQYGIPIIATNIGAHTELIQNEINGLLVPPSSPQAIATKIDMLIDNKKLYKQISKNSISKSVEYSFTQFAETIRKQLEEL
jgi:glycosyltransferase involved in cell wall biosynthesis